MTLFFISVVYQKYLGTSKKYANLKYFFRSHGLHVITYKIYSYPYRFSISSPATSPPSQTISCLIEKSKYPKRYLVIKSYFYVIGYMDKRHTP